MRKTSVMLAAVAMLAVSSMASAATMTPGTGMKGSWFIGPMGAISVPTGDLSDKDKLNSKLGFDIGGLVDYALTDQIGIGVDGAFNSMVNKDDSNVKFKTTSFGVHGNWFMPTGGNIMPYLGVGVGYYNRKIEGSSGSASVSLTSGSVGANGGVGVGIMATPSIGLAVDARYHFTPSTNFDVAGAEKINWSFMTFNAAVLFHIPMGGGAGASSSGGMK
jgi:outer membrane protein W